MGVELLEELMDYQGIYNNFGIVRFVSDFVAGRIQIADNGLIFTRRYIAPDHSLIAYMEVPPKLELFYQDAISILKARLSIYKFYAQVAMYDIIISILNNERIWDQSLQRYILLYGPDSFSKILDESIEIAAEITGYVRTRDKSNILNQLITDIGKLDIDNLILLGIVGSRNYSNIVRILAGRKIKIVSPESGIQNPELILQSVIKSLEIITNKLESVVASNPNLTLIKQVDQFLSKAMETIKLVSQKGGENENPGT